MKDGQWERIAVKVEDIEQMILMSDKVVDEVMMGQISSYDENGVPFPLDEAAERYKEQHEQHEKDHRDGTDLLVYKIVHEKHKDFESVLAITASDLEKRLAHLKKRILGIFRSGVLEEWYRFYYYADDSVPDDWLFTMFLMRVRDRMIVFASQRLHDDNQRTRRRQSEEESRRRGGRMIYLTGDTHRDFDRIFDFCADNDTTTDDVLIILGDAGINYFLDERDHELKKVLSTLEVTLFCIHGNHEERPFMIDSYVEKEWRGGVVYYEEEFPNLLFAKDGEIYDLEGRKAIAIGGAYSVDKYWRLEGNSPWFPTEQPTDEIMDDVERALDRVGWKVDAVLSHTAPLKYEPTEEFLSFVEQETVDKTTEEWLDTIEDRLDYERWYCGHYHCCKKIDRITIMFEDFEELF